MMNKPQLQANGSVVTLILGNATVSSLSSKLSMWLWDMAAGGLTEDDHEEIVVDYVLKLSDREFAKIISAEDYTTVLGILAPYLELEAIYGHRFYVEVISPQHPHRPVYLAVMRPSKYIFCIEAKDLAFYSRLLLHISPEEVAAEFAARRNEVYHD